MNTLPYFLLYFQNNKVCSRIFRGSSHPRGRGVCLSACWDTQPPPGCGPGDPPGVGLETPHGQTPQLPHWVWPGDPSCKACWDVVPERHAGIPPPWIPARHAGIPSAMHAGIPPLYARHAGIPPARHAGIPPPPLDTCKACWDTIPPWTEFLTHASENITLPQTLFAGGNNKVCKKNFSST